MLHVRYISMQVIARGPEQETLRELMASKKPELVAIYGRLRVGKTFTVSQTLQENSGALYFEVTGSLREDGRARPQQEFLSDFSIAWTRWIGERRNISTAEDCLLALVELDRRAAKARRPLYLFLDELPWIARSSPRFFSGLATLWNNSLSKNPYLKLFVAASATSWMMDHVIHARAGLAKRVTAQIHMRPLDLAQTRLFLAAKGLQITRNEVLQVYSALGGIPFYLDLLTRKDGASKNLYQLLVPKSAMLYAGAEYEALFRYLFARDGAYRKVIDTLVTQKYGMTYAELSNRVTGKPEPSGGLLRVLENMERSELIERRLMFLNRSKGTRLYVTDEYIRFVSRWLRNSGVSTFSAFNRIFSSQSYASWQGFDFELTAFKNVHLVSQALGISGIPVEPFVYYRDKDVQIDLLLERGDQTITLCEAKSYDSQYEPTEKDVTRFRIRRQAIEELLKTKRRPPQFINYCFVVRNGIKRNRYFNEINAEVADLSQFL